MYVLFFLYLCSAMRFLSEIEKVLDDLMSCGSPFGQEERVTNLFVHLISPYVDDVQRDIYGNVVAMKKRANQ